VSKLVRRRFSRPRDFAFFLAVVPLVYLGLFASIGFVFTYWPQDPLLVVASAPIISFCFFARVLGFSSTSGAREALRTDSLALKFVTGHRLPTALLTAEVLVWYSLGGVAFWHVFPALQPGISTLFESSGSDGRYVAMLNGLAVFAAILVGLVVMFVLTIVTMTALMTVSAPLERFFEELTLFRRAISRVGSFSFLFVAFVVVFAFAYRILAFSDESAFVPQVLTMADSIYLSVSTATVVGDIQIQPLSGAARLVVAFETLGGALLIFALLALVISLPLQVVKPPRRSSLRDDSRPISVRLSRGRAARRLQYVSDRRHNRSKRRSAVRAKRRAARG